jgi:hypothetical protein
VTAGRLSVAGTKTFALNVGSNRDAVLQQSLDVSLTGTISPGVSVAAALSDQNLPVTGQGASAGLRELDRAWVSVTAPSGDAVFGDFDWSAPPSEFAAFSRRLSGVRGVARAGGGEVHVAAASSRGRWITAEIYGRDGIQGPYPLLGSSTGPGDIVPGSERVWLDGERLRSGEEADYVVDVFRGTITLSPRRPVSSRTRLVVDLQVGERESARMIYSVAAARSGAVGSIGVTFAREVDGPGATESLSEEDRAILAAAGDTIPSLLLGVREVGPGNGNYVRAPGDSVTPAHFAYAGEDSGDVRLDFLFVGAGRGDYTIATTTEGGVFYAFAGAGRGTHAIGRIAQPPLERSVLDVRAQALRAGPLRVLVEGAVSRADLNTLSALADDDNAGHAVQASVRADAVPVRAGGRGFGRITLDVSARDRAARFATLGRVEDAVAGDRWGLGSTALERGARSAAAAVRYDATRHLRATVDGGRLRAPDGSTADRLARGLAFGADVESDAPVHAEIARETW